MSTTPGIRRAEKALPEESVSEILETGFSGHLATVGSDGYPYCLPLLYVWMDGKIWVHATAAKGHLRANVDHDSRVCFEIDCPGGFLSPPQGDHCLRHHGRAADRQVQSIAAGC